MFKVGDKVRCVDFEGTAGEKLKASNIELFTVKRIEQNFVTLEEFKSSYRVTRFVRRESDNICNRHEQVNKILKETQAKRFNSNKAEFFDAPLLAMAEVAKVAAYGRSKYDKYNWKKEAPMSQYHDCRQRHELKYWYGQDNDSESKCHHLAHLAWNALAALEKVLTGTDVDDRYKGYPKEFVDNLEDVFALNEEQKEAIKEQLDKKDKK